MVHDLQNFSSPMSKYNKISEDLPVDSPKFSTLLTLSVTQAGSRKSGAMGLKPHVILRVLHRI